MKINKLLDHLIELGGLKNDAALSRALKVAPPVISKMRNGMLLVNASFIIRAHEAFEISISDIKFIAGMDAISSVRRRSSSTAKAAA